MSEKNSKIQKFKQKNSLLVIESLVFKLQPTHGKEGRRSTIPTKETRATSRARLVGT